MSAEEKDKRESASDEPVTPQALDEDGVAESQAEDAAETGETPETADAGEAASAPAPAASEDVAGGVAADIYHALGITAPGEERVDGSSRAYEDLSDDELLARGMEPDQLPNGKLFAFMAGLTVFMVVCFAVFGSLYLYLAHFGAPAPAVDRDLANLRAASRAALAQPAVMDDGEARIALGDAKALLLANPAWLNRHPLGTGVDQPTPAPAPSPVHEPTPDDAVDALDGEAEGAAPEEARD
mgnify:CR=1 FL=1